MAIIFTANSDVSNNCHLIIEIDNGIFDNMDILIAGDYAPIERLAQKMDERNYHEVFPEDIRSLVKCADFSFVNFESPVIDNGFEAIPKNGPNLHCSSSAVEGVKYCGFTGVTMANNHILDFGEKGLRKSVDICKAQGLDIVGVGDNCTDANKTLFLEKDGTKIAVINCCEHEFSIATDKSAGANPLNPIKQFYAIKEAKRNSNYVIVIVHGGHECFQLPSVRMQETYRFFIDAGADSVINHHQHCFSGYEVYSGKPIFYGLGNFCFDDAGDLPETWYYGYMVMLHLYKGDVKFSLHPYVQCKETMSVSLISDSNEFEEEINKLNEVIADPQKLRNALDEYYSKKIQYFKLMYQPYGNRILTKLFNMRLLPSFVSKRKFLKIFNNISCQSHIDKQLYVLKKIIEE